METSNWKEKLLIVKFFMRFIDEFYSSIRSPNVVHLVDLVFSL